MSGSMSAIELTVGEVRRRKFRLRKKGQRDFFPVQDASEIRIEMWTDGEDPFLPVYAVRESGFDDWNTGKVTFLLSPLNATLRPLTYAQKIIVVLDGEEIIFPGDVVEVGPRTTSRFTLPGFGKCQLADNVLVGPPVSALTVGMPVQLDTVLGLKPAAGNLPISGFALNASDIDYTAAYVSAGWIERSDWTPIVGSPYLPASTQFMVGSTPGTLTPVTMGTTPVASSDASGRRLTFG